MGSIDGHKRTYGLFNQLTFDFHNLSSAHSWAGKSVLQRTHGLYSISTVLTTRHPYCRIDGRHYHGLSEASLYPGMD